MHWKDKYILQNHTFFLYLGLILMLCRIRSSDLNPNASNTLRIFLNT